MYTHAQCASLGDTRCKTLLLIRTTLQNPRCRVHSASDAKLLGRAKQEHKELARAPKVAMLVEQSHRRLAIPRQWCSHQHCKLGCNVQGSYRSTTFKQAYPRKKKRPRAVLSPYLRVHLWCFPAFSPSLHSSHTQKHTRKQTHTERQADVYASFASPEATAHLIS